jgi:ubiquitin
MKVEKLEREFRYSGGLRLPDPNPNLSVEEVRNLAGSVFCMCLVPFKRVASLTLTGCKWSTGRGAWEKARNSRTLKIDPMVIALRLVTELVQ